MRILIVSQYFYPEEFKINDLTKELVLKGHQVTVLTGKPNYPKGEYFDGYSYSGITREEYFGAKVIRVPLRKRGRGGPINLVLNYLSYVYNAIKFLRHNKMAFDSILCFEVSPITQAYPALYCKRKYGGKVLLWVQDLWPESVTAAGGVNGKCVLSFLDKMVKRIYSKCDVLLIQSEAFRNSILSKGDFASKLIYAPNWAEEIYLKREYIGKPEVEKLIPNGFIVMFAGNVGAAQDIDSIIQAANVTRETRDIKWVIVGDGRARVEAEKRVKELGLNDTVFFLGRHPMEKMPTFFSFADAMIISLKDDYIFSLTIPSKTQSYMASGKPIVSMLNGEGRRIIELSGCGFVAPAGDFKSLAKNVVKLYHMDSKDRMLMGQKGQDYYLKHFNKETVISTIIDSMR